MKNTPIQRIGCCTIFKGSTKLSTKEVIPAQPYRPDWKSEKLSNVLITQYQFPQVYEARDHLCTENSNVLFGEQLDYTTRCLYKHIGIAELCFLEWWMREAPPHQVLPFVRELLWADPTIPWTGYRLTGSADGNAVYTIEIFAKHPASGTEVYSMEDATNVSKITEHA